MPVCVGVGGVCGLGGVCCARVCACVCEYLLDIHILFFVFFVYKKVHNIHACVSFILKYIETCLCIKMGHQRFLC